jgi:hypothetical protein
MPHYPIMLIYQPLFCCYALDTHRIYTNPISLYIRTVVTHRRFACIYTLYIGTHIERIYTYAFVREALCNAFCAEGKAILS